jgi:hypothetical protein
MSFRLLSKNIKISIQGTIILHVVLYEYEIWSLILREGDRLILFENRVLRRVVGPSQEGAGNCIMMSFVTCVIRIIQSRKMRWAAHVGRMWEGECI